MLRRIFVAAALLGSGMAAPAAAAAIAVDQWYTFSFEEVGSALATGDGATLGSNPESIAAPDAPWTFSLAGAGVLTVVDGFNSGDEFTITNFGTTLGRTSPSIAGNDCGGDITACLTNPAISKGVFALAAGDYSLGGTVATSPFPAGAGFFRVSSVAGAVPEPASWALMIAGFGGIGMTLRRRNASRRAPAAV